MSDARLERNKKITLDFIETTHRQDYAAATDMLTKDVVFRMHPSPDEIRGRDAFAQICEATSSIFKPGTITTEKLRVIAEGDTVIAEVITRGVTARGENYENRYVLIALIEDDKVAEFDEYVADSAYRARAFGLDLA